MTVPAHPSRVRRGFAIAAIILGVAPIILAFVRPLIMTALLSIDSNYLVANFAYFGIMLPVTLGCGIAAVVCGMIARRTTPLVAGIGIGIGIAGLCYLTTIYLSYLVW